MDFTPGIFDLLYENLDIDSKDEIPVKITLIDQGKMDIQILGIKVVSLFGKLNQCQWSIKLKIMIQHTYGR